VHLEITALLLESLEAGSFETHHNQLGGGHILAKVAHNSDILPVRLWLVANCVSSSIESADKTAERLEMVDVKAGNHTHVAVAIDWSLSQIDCLCHWQFVNFFPITLNYLHGNVGCQIGHLDMPCSLSSVEICASTCSVNNDAGKLL